MFWESTNGPSRIGLIENRTMPNRNFGQKRLWTRVSSLKLNFNASLFSCYFLKSALNQPRNNQNWNSAKITPKSDVFMRYSLRTSFGKNDSKSKHCGRRDPALYLSLSLSLSLSQIPAIFIQKCSRHPDLHHFLPSFGLLGSILDNEPSNFFHLFLLTSFLF